MKLSEFDYYLPKNLIAQKPIKPRDYSRLLIAEKNKKIQHKYFYSLIDYLKKGDILVFNNSKVFPARLIGKKKKTKGKIEVFLLHPNSENVWQCLFGGRGCKKGLEIELEKSLNGVVIKECIDGVWEIKFNKNKNQVIKIAEKIGKIPLPPYIKRDKINNNSVNDKKQYQTVYADNKKIGSSAAPTAGLHFTKELLKKIKNKGIIIEYITLHVGLGTFSPVKVDNIKKHKIHKEWVEVDKKTISRIYSAKLNNQRIIAVGTTSVRTLEAIANKIKLKNKQKFLNFNEWVDIFIYPEYKFKLVDAMITNFHLPKSTLLMLVSAFIGKNNIKKMYKKAVDKKYRFYSYGDAMFLR